MGPCERRSVPRHCCTIPALWARWHPPQDAYPRQYDCVSQQRQPWCQYVILARMSFVNAFYGFSALPVELRLKVWSIALSVPRNVDIICDTDIWPIPRSATSFWPGNGPPVLLHVCHESRSEALKIYKPLLQLDSAPVYVSLPQDTIRASQVFLYPGGAKLLGIQRMSINIQDYSDFGFWGIKTLQNMQPDLKELELVFEQGSLYTRYLFPPTVMDDIRYWIAQGWYYCPNINIVDGQSGETIERILGRKY